MAFDSIETPFGKVNKTLGGSATYFSLAASYFCKPSLVAVVGTDFNNQSAFKKRSVDISGLSRASGKTFHWAGKYHFDLNTRDTLKTELGVFANFKPVLSELQKNARFVFLGNIHPKLQLEVLKQIQNPKLVGLDTMNLWIDTALKDLKEVLKQVDVFIINDSEARQLSGQHNILKAAKKILGMMTGQKTLIRHPAGDTFSQREKENSKNFNKKTLIIKRGEYGLLMFSNSHRPGHSSRYGYGYRSRYGNSNPSTLSPFHFPGLPLEDVTDPTGAGDSFAGGFMGYLAKMSSTSTTALKQACAYGSVMASFCVQNFGTKNLLSLNPRQIENRLGEFKKLIGLELRNTIPSLTRNPFNGKYPQR